MPKPPDPFHVFILELLAGAGPIRIRRMFGGAGVFTGGLMFALLADGQIYLKADESLRADLTAEGCLPFLYFRAGDSKGVDLGYVALPSSAMDDADEAVAWARRAIGVAQAADAKKPPKQRRSRPG